MRISDWSSDVCSSDLAASIAVVQLVGVVAAGTVGEPHVAAAIGDELRVLHRRARHHDPSARVDVEPLGTRVRVVAEWPCRDDQALVVVAQVIDHEGRDAFVPLRSEEHTSELKSLISNTYAVFFLHKKK